MLTEREAYLQGLKSAIADRGENTQLLNDICEALGRGPDAYRVLRINTIFCFETEMNQVARELSPS